MKIFYLKIWVKINQRKNGILVYLFLFFVVIITLESAYYSSCKEWTFSSPDAYAEMSISKRIAQGMWFKLNSDEPPSTITPGFLNPLIWSLIYKLSFNNDEFFTFLLFIWGALCLFFTLIFIYRTLREFFGEISIFYLFFIILFPFFFFNYFMGLNFSLFSLLFWGTFAYLKNGLKFLIFAFPLCLTRPDSPFAILFFTSVYFFTLKKKQKKYFLIFFSLFLFSLLQFIMNYLLTGNFITYGVKPQLIFHYYSLSQGISKGIETFLNQTKAFFIGSFPSTVKIATFLKGGHLIPFLGMLALTAFLDKKNRVLFSSFLIYFIILLLGDSFTIFSAIHLNRHMAHTYPLWIFMAIYGTKNLLRASEKYEVSFILLIFYFSFFVLNWVYGLAEYADGVKLSYLYKKSAQSAVKIIPPDKEVIVEDVYFFYYGMNKLKVRIFTPAFYPYLGKYVSKYFRLTERSKLIQRFLHNCEYYYKTPTDVLMYQILPFIRDTLWQNYEPSVPTALFRIDLTKIKKESFLPPPYKLIWELDVGDPISEKESKYFYFTDIEGIPASGFDKGIIRSDTIWDVGRLIIGCEEFEIKVVPNDTNYFVIRFGDKFNHWIMQKYTLNPLKIKFQEVKINISFNDKYYFFMKIKNLPESFQEKIIKIPPAIVSNKKIKVHVKGNYISYHYFVYSKKQPHF